MSGRGVTVKSVFAELTKASTEQERAREMEGTREYKQKTLTRHKIFSLITKPNLALLWELFTQQNNCAAAWNLC